MPSNKILLFIRTTLYLDFTIYSYIFILLYTWLEFSENNINNFIIFPFASKLTGMHSFHCLLIYEYVSVHTWCVHMRVSTGGQGGW